MHLRGDLEQTKFRDLYFRVIQNHLSSRLLDKQDWNGVLLGVAYTQIPARQQTQQLYQK